VDFRLNCIILRTKNRATQYKYLNRAPLYLTRRLQSVLTAPAALTMSLTHSSAFTRCVLLSAPCPMLPSWCTRFSTAVYRRTLACSPTLPTLQVTEGFAVPAATAYSSTFDSPFHCWQPSIFGCWPSGVELPATGSYVGAVSGDVVHSTQDIYVY